MFLLHSWEIFFFYFDDILVYCKSMHGGAFEECFPNLEGAKDVC